MNNTQLTLIVDIVKRLGAIVGVPEFSIIDALIGIAWDEEEAGKIKNTIEDAW